jgi:predicted ATPase
MAIISKIDLTDQTSRKLSKYNYTLYPGLNILIGPNGSGKSTIMDIISGRLKVYDYKKVVSFTGEDKVFHFDFEKDNLRLKTEPQKHISPMSYVLSKWVSHGQFNIKVVEALKTKEGIDHSLILMDEPEQALDIENLVKLKETITFIIDNKLVDQVIISTHSPILIFGTKAHIIETEDNYHSKLRHIIFNSMFNSSNYIDVEEYYK